MGVMDLDHEIGDRELQLMHPELRGRSLRHKAMAATQIEQDVGDLREHELAGSEEWRRKRWRAGLRLQQFRHRSHATRLASDVAIGSPDLFQSQPDVFAAALDGGPVVKLVTHETVLAIRRRSYDPSLSIPRQNKKKRRGSVRGAFSLLLFVASAPGQFVCWIAETCQLPPRSRMNVQTSVTCIGCSEPSTSRPLARSSVVSTSEKRSATVANSVSPSRQASARSPCR